MEYSEQPVLAWTEALDRVGGDQEFLSQLVGCLLLDLDSHMGELRRAVAEGDGAQTQRVLSTIEAKASKVCAMALVHAAGTVEGLSSRAQADRIQTETDRLREVWNTFQGRVLPQDQASDLCERPPRSRVPPAASPVVARLGR